MTDKCYIDKDNTDLQIVSSPNKYNNIIIIIIMYGVYNFEQGKLGPHSVKVYDYLTVLDNSKFRKRVSITLFPVLFLSEADLEILKF
jgi:hypothetical protein